MALVPPSPTVDLEELDRVGFTVVRGLLPRTLTTALRQCTYLALRTLDNYLDR